ncbi:MAG: ribosomal protein S18-alanine N-acetyltransferase [Chloroflexi bacterium]|nr:ribosomal protein S18-alanine N-acetyltransferase [Chloroflexota bacterium]
MDAELPFTLDEMQLADIPHVMAIERRVFPMTWSSGIYQRELTSNPWSHYRVLRSTQEGLPPILAVGGIWLVDKSAHIATIATHPDYMGRQLGGYLLLHLLVLAHNLGCTEASLEVRASNTRAQALYRKYGFVEVGRRRRYYSDNREDALIMTRPSLDLDSLREELAIVEKALLALWRPEEQRGQRSEERKNKRRKRADKHPTMPPPKP